MSSGKLNAKQQSIVTIAAMTAKGDMPNLTTALDLGLNAGLSVNEIKEILVQLYAYCGFPRSLNALGNFMQVVKARKDKGYNDQIGQEAGPFPSGKTKLDLGTQIQTQLVGEPVKGALFDFAPAIDAFLKEHLFGDIFGRDNLDWQSRELATVAALASMDGLGSQLESHMKISMNVGIAEALLQDLVGVLSTKVGSKEGSNAQAALNKVLAK